MEEFQALILSPMLFSPQPIDRTTQKKGFTVGYTPRSISIGLTSSMLDISSAAACDTAITGATAPSAAAAEKPGYLPCRRPNLCATPRGDAPKRRESGAARGENTKASHVRMVVAVAASRTVAARSLALDVLAPEVCLEKRGGRFVHHRTCVSILLNSSF